MLATAPGSRASYSTQVLELLFCGSVEDKILSAGPQASTPETQIDCTAVQLSGAGSSVYPIVLFLNYSTLSSAQTKSACYVQRFIRLISWLM